MQKVEVHPVLDSDLAAFSAFSVPALNAKCSVDEYQKGFTRPWSDSKPNNGFMLVTGTDIVGVIGAIYASRNIRGRREHFCNITGWTVLEKYRAKSLQLAHALTRQPGFHYTDFTPTKVVSDSLRFLNFKTIDARQIRVRCRPGLRHKFSKISVIDELPAILANLEGAALDISRAHAEIPWLRQLIVRQGRKQCLLLMKPYEESGNRIAAIVGVCARENFIGLFSQIRHVLATQYATHFLRFEQRLLGYKPYKSSAIQFAPRRMYRSETLTEMDIDCLYSEIVALEQSTKLI